MYTRLDQNFTGTAVLTPSAPKPTAVYQFKDQDTVSSMFALSVTSDRNRLMLDRRAPDRKPSGLFIRPRIVGAADPRPRCGFSATGSANFPLTQISYLLS